MKRFPLFKTSLISLMLFAGGCRFWRRRDPEPPPPPVVRELRLPNRQTPLEDFQMTAGWTVHSESGLTEFLKNEPKAIWGDYAGEIRFSPRSAGPHSVALTPREPWLQPSVFNTIILWVWDDGEAGLRDDHAIRIQARDRNGKPLEWTLPYSPANEWQMLHLRSEAGFPWPIEIESLHWELPAHVDRPRTLYLESFTMYQESLSRIPGNIQFIRPHGYAPAFAPQRPSSVMLDFPPRPATFRPAPPETRHVISVARTGVETHAFTFLGAEGEWVYEVTASPGAPQIKVRQGETPWPDLWRGLNVATSGDVPEHRFSRLENDVLHMQYEQGLRFVISLHGRSLQIEIHSLGETFHTLNLGSLGGGDNVRAMPIFPPFMRVNQAHRWPVVQLRQNDEQVFASLLPDWWFSMAGAWEPGEIFPDRESFGRMTYPARWKGTRNVFRERLHLTVSPHFREVLPSPSGVEALYRDQAGSLLWRDEIAESAELNLFTLHPTHQEWRDNLLARDPEGNWRELGRGNHILKSARFSDTSLTLLQTQLREKPPGASHVFLDQGADVPPWVLTDFDARVLGAGTYAQTWAEMGALLQQAVAESGGPLIAPGGGEWLQAGFVSGFVSDFTLGFGELHPYLPQFAHRNILPFSTLHGLGPLEGFRLPGESRREEVMMHRQIATQIAYGACGRIPEVASPRLRQRAERILRPLHHMFTDDPVIRLAYWDGTRFMEAGEAMATGAFVRSQIYMRLQSGTEIWVNGDLHGHWHLRAATHTFELPPSGFVVRDDDLLMVYALTSEGEPFWVMDKPGDIFWLDAHEARHDFADVELRGSLFLRGAKPGRPAMIEVESPDGRIRIPQPRLGITEFDRVEVRNRAGREVDDVQIRAEGNDWVLETPPAFRKITFFNLAD
ncbi:MAG: hypothetical protein JJU29_07805 [Verrucomicrobia bacterium]|nr:hypothetical protein [Verrucomicrobiota bacterium]MCH8511969.1 hypothetical protein [Kiritimatiellia bacterium]